MTKGDLINKVYDILVETCGADQTKRVEFVMSLSNPARVPEEYNFGGILGAGGKFWIRSFIVSCYKHDLNRERKKIITDANTKLMALRQQISH